jgi:L-iditol 2-dehydrogenase
MGQLLKILGAYVAGCDLIEERISLARELNFDRVYKYTSDEEISGLIKKNIQKEGVDTVFLASGSVSSLSLSISSVRDGGTILIFASVGDDLAGFSNNKIYYRELKILGSYSPSPQDLNDSLNLVKDNIIKLDKLFTEYDLSEISQALKDTCSNSIIKAFVRIIN